MSVPAGKIPPAPYIIISEELIEKWSKVLNITPSKGYKVKQSISTENER